MSKIKYELALFLTWGVYFISLFSRMMSMRPDGLYVGHENLWSDWALHLSMANTFATKAPRFWFSYHPVFADGKMTYAFLTNLISALFMRAGFSVPFSFIFPSIACALVLLYAMLGVLTLLLRSKPKAFVALSIFFLSAGLGFVDHLGGFLKTGASLTALPSYDWLDGNVISGQLLPQRAFLLGMPLALLGLAGLFYFLSHHRQEGCAGAKRCDSRQKRILLLAGLCVGILPVAHMHSLIALIILLAPVALVSLADWRALLYFVLPAGLLSSLLFFVYIAGGIQQKGFMSLVPGFGAHGFFDWLWFWWLAWGLLIPLAVTGLILLWPTVTKEVRALFVGFFLLFAAANLVQFQPTRWDNSKMFLWCAFGFSALAAHALFEISRRKGLLGQVSAASLGAALVLTGVIVTFDLQRVDRHTYRLLSTEQMDLAEKIREKTDPLARFATAFTHDHPVAIWAARPVLLGYRSWAGNYGFVYAEIERDVAAIYRGAPETPGLLKKHRVSYVYLGPAERRQFNVNENYFSTHFPVAFQSPLGDERVYDVRSAL